METLQRQMVGHGLLVIVAALLAGFMLGFGLIGGLEVMPGKIVSMPYYGTTEGWVRAHVGGLTNGLMVIAVALSLPLISMSQSMKRKTAYGLIFVAWANTVFYWFGNAASNRALSIGDNPLGPSDWFGVVGFFTCFSRRNHSPYITDLCRDQISKRRQPRDLLKSKTVSQKTTRFGACFCCEYFLIV